METQRILDTLVVVKLLPTLKHALLTSKPQKVSQDYECSPGILKSAEFSSNPNQTHLSILIRVFKIIRKSQVARRVWSGLEINSAADCTSRERFEEPWVAYLKVTHAIGSSSFFLAPDFWCLFKGIFVHQLWSFAFSRERSRAQMREWCVTFLFIFILSNWDGAPSGSWCPTQTAYSAYRERRYCMKENLV